MMHSRFKRLSLTIAVLVAGLWTLLGTATSPRPPGPSANAPEFESFGVSPNPICVNPGALTVIRIAWRVRGSGGSCFSNLRVNGTGVDGVFWSNVLGGRCGENDYAREVSFSMREAFGNNIPAEVLVEAELKRRTQAGVFVGSELLDTASAVTTARDCPPPNLTPGG